MCVAIPCHSGEVGLWIQFPQMGSWEYMCVWAGDVKVSSMEFLKLAQGALRYAEDCVCVGGGGCLYFCGFLHLPKVLMLISWASRKQNGPSDSPLYNALPFTAVLFSLCKCEMQYSENQGGSGPGSSLFCLASKATGAFLSCCSRSSPWMFCSGLCIATQWALALV